MSLLEWRAVVSPRGSLNFWVGPSLKEQLHKLWSISDHGKKECGDSPQDKILAALANGGNSLSLAGTSFMTEDIEKGVANIISVKTQEAISTEVPVVGRDREMERQRVVGAVRA